MARASWATLFLLFLLPVKSLYEGDGCTEDDKEGTCVPIPDCAPILAAIERAGKPMPLHMRKRLQAIQCGFGRSGPVVCCVPETETEAPVTEPIPSVTPPAVPHTESRISAPPEVQNHPNLHLLPEDCGSYEDDRLIGGEKTSIYELPWMALVSYDTNRGVQFGCGGTLINERYVLTAAHCISNLGTKKLKAIILGEHDVRTDPDCERVNSMMICAEKSKNLTIESVIAHPGFNMQSLVDDIGLVRLSEKVDINQPSVRAVCLPVTPDIQKEQLVGLNGTVAGWGATESGLQSPVLLRVDVPFVTLEECNKAYKGKPRILEKQLCAGGVVGKDSCQGDSGGPIMYVTVNGKLVQRGIVSFGVKHCGTGGFPGVYTNAAYYMNWILDNIRE